MLTKHQNSLKVKARRASDESQNHEIGEKYIGLRTIMEVARRIPHWNDRISLCGALHKVN